MLAPPLLLPPPKQLDTKLEGDSVLRTVKNQYFNHSVSVILSDALHPPESVTSVLTDDTSYYHICKLPAYELVDSQFISLFVKTGSLTLHSIDTRLDQDDCLAILPTGVLILSLTTNTFQQLGLEGKASDFVNGRFMVKFDLKSEMFQSGSRIHSRILERFRALPELTFNVILSWQPIRKEICPSSIAAWFSEASYHVDSCPNQFDRKTLYSVKVPDYEKNDVLDVLEWAGMVHMQCTMEPANSGISMYEIPSPNVDMGQVLALQWTGLFAATTVNEALERLKSWVDGRSSNTWACMTVHGLDDSVTTHGEKEHHFYVEGDYSISVFLRPLKPFTALSHVSSYRAPVGRNRAKKRRAT